MDPALQVFVVAIVGGIAAQWLARTTRLPAIVPLLLLGIAAGPDIIGLMPRPSEAIQHAFPAIVELGVAVILFDGGLSLTLRDLRSAPRAVSSLLTIGAAVTFGGAMACAVFVAGLSPSAAAIYAALMIVTGPTVIVPLLQHLHLSRRVHTVLLWEAILIDAIGASAAFVTMEFIMEGGDLFHAGGSFFGALVAGPAIGIAGGYALARVLRYRRRHTGAEQELSHLLALAGSLVIYAVSEQLVSSSGLGAVIAAGMLIANIMGEQVEDLRKVKATITRFLVAVLFMLLAADFPLRTLQPLWPAGFAAIALVMFAVRPLNVLLSSFGAKLSWPERVFIGLVGPRGIVAASVASLFGMMLKERGQVQMGEQLVAMTFLTILATVLMSGVGAGPLARVLGLIVRRPAGLLIAGANELALKLAGIYEVRGIHCLLVDTNPDLCDRARLAGFRVAQGSALDTQFLASQDLAGIGAVVAATSSTAVNSRAATQTATSLGLEDAYVVDAGLASDLEASMLEAPGVNRAFARHVNVDAVCDLIASGRAFLRMHPGGGRQQAEGEAQEEARPFLRLAVLEGDIIRPCAAGKSYGRQAEVIGLEFALLPGETQPFADGE